MGHRSGFIASTDHRYGTSDAGVLTESLDRATVLVALRAATASAPRAGASSRSCPMVVAESPRPDVDAALAVPVDLRM